MVRWPNKIAATQANGPCVFHTDASGQVESFKVAADGALTQVSSVTVADGSSTYGGDTHVSADGKFLYVAAWGSHLSTINVLTVGSSCALTLASTLTANGAGYFSIALLDGVGLEAVDSIGNFINIYHISHGTNLTLVSSTPAQVLFSADGAAATLRSPIGPLVFNGVAGGTETEVHTVNAKGMLGNVPGSPASDPDGSDSVYVFYDALYGQLIGAEQFSNSLGFYGKVVSGYGLLGHSPVASAKFPAAMTEVGSELYILGQGGPGLDACMLALGSATCSPAASVPDSAADGIGVL